MDTKALQAYLDSLVSEEEFSGVVLIQGPTGVEFSGAYGFASRRWSVPCSPNIRFDTASMTKLFTAVAVLQQIEAGAFELETKAVEYLELAGTQISPDATVYHLLTHTSGIGDDADEEAGERYEDLWIDRPNYAVTQTEHFLPQFAQKPEVFAPGEGCRYCNCSYVLLGLMVERATGLSYRDYVTARVFEKAEMSRAGFFDRNIHEPAVAEGEEPIKGADGTIREWRGNLYSSPPIGSPDGGAHVMASDLVKFLHALQRGRLLGPEMTQAMFVPRERYRVRKSGKLHMMGFAFEFETSDDGAIHSYWKEGINVGVSGILRFYPATSRTVVVLSNMESGAWAPIRWIDDAVSE